MSESLQSLNQQYPNHCLVDDQWVKDQIVTKRGVARDDNWYKDFMSRDLIVNYIDDPSGNWAISFLLAGSPPKGYALYIPGKMIIINQWGTSVTKYNRYYVTPEKEPLIWQNSHASSYRESNWLVKQYYQRRLSELITFNRIKRLAENKVTIPEFKSKYQFLKFFESYFKEDT